MIGYTRTPRRRCPRGSRLHADRRRPRTRAAARLHARPHRTRASAARAGQRTAGRARFARTERIRGPYRASRPPSRSRAIGPARPRGCGSGDEFQGRLRCRSSTIGRRRVATFGDDEMRGTPVGPATRVTGLRAGRELQVPIGDWPTGLYFAQLTAPGPRRLRAVRRRAAAPGREPRRGRAADANLAGVQPAGRRRERRPRHLVHRPRARPASRLGRPFEHRGVPPHFRTYDLGFLQWLHDTGRGVDVLAQEDLDETTGARARRRVRPVVFPGHHEYVTEAEYDAVTGFRDQGGNLMFLSANNFFWRDRRPRRRDDARGAVAEARSAGGRPARRAVLRERQRRQPRSLAGSPVGAALALRRCRARAGPNVLARRHRDRRRRAELAARHPGRRVDPGPPRAWSVRPHDLLRDAEGSEGLLRGRLHPRRLDPAAGGADAADERVGAACTGGQDTERAPAHDARARTGGRLRRARCAVSRICCPSTPRSSSRARWSARSPPACSRRWCGRQGPGSIRAPPRATASTSGGRSGSAATTG